MERTALTESWTRFALTCQHDWTLRYVNSGRAFARSYGDGFPYHYYPVASRSEADAIAAGLQWLSIDQARSNVLNAVGSRDNLLRFVSAMALIGRNTNDHSEPLEWWAKNSRYFVIVTNREKAIELLDSWERDADGLLSYGIEQSRSLTERER